MLDFIFAYNSLETENIRYGTQLGINGHIVPEFECVVSEEIIMKSENKLNPRMGYKADNYT